MLLDSNGFLGQRFPARRWIYGYPSLGKGKSSLSNNLRFICPTYSRNNYIILETSIQARDRSHSKQNDTSLRYKELFLCGSSGEITYNKTCLEHCRAMTGLLQVCHSVRMTANLPYPIDRRGLLRSLRDLEPPLVKSLLALGVPWCRGSISRFAPIAVAIEIHWYSCFQSVD
jgi:hypothetical protein